MAYRVGPNTVLKLRWQDGSWYPDVYPKQGEVDVLEDRLILVSWGLCSTQMEGANVGFGDLIVFKISGFTETEDGLTFTRDVEDRTQPTYPISIYGLIKSE